MKRMKVSWEQHCLCLRLLIHNADILRIDSESELVSAAVARLELLNDVLPLVTDNKIIDVDLGDSVLI